MQKDKLAKVLDYIVKNSKFLFPVFLIAAVAVTVSVALNAGNQKNGEESSESTEESFASGSLPEATTAPEPAGTRDVVLTANEDEAIWDLVIRYYNAMAAGDSAAMSAIYDEVSENDLLRYEETAKYLSTIPAIDIYTKPGPAEGTSIVYVYYKLCFLNHEEQEVPGWQTFYVCQDEEGGLYIKNEMNFTEAEKEYIIAVSAQDDVVDFNNRVSVEYNELVTKYPELLNYMGELGKQINATIGVRLAEQNAAQSTEQPPDGSGQGAPTEAPDAQAPDMPAELGPRYATANTTVNVRNSDSEQAEKLGKVAEGDRVQVQEVRVNGWSKIVFEGGDGYVKSEYLKMEETPEGQAVIGTVTANENVKIRASASADAGQLGLMAAGDSLELLAVENGWCKVIYDGKVGYVKEEFVTRK